MFKVVSLDHIGIAVHDLEASAQKWKDLVPGITIDSRNTLELVRAENYMLGAGNAQIELLAPMEGDTAISGFLERRGEGFYFLTLFVDDILKGCEEMEARGMRIVESWGPRAEALHVFVHPRDGKGIYLQLMQWDKAAAGGSITTRIAMPDRPAASDPKNGFHVVALHSVTHGVKDLEGSLQWWQDVFRAEATISPRDVPALGIREAAVAAGNAAIVLAAPLGDDSPLARRLEAKGEGIVFVTFEVENLGMGLEYLRSKGTRIVETLGDAANPDFVTIHPESASGVYVGLVDAKQARSQGMDKGIAIGAKVRP